MSSPLAATVHLGQLLGEVKPIATFQLGDRTYSVLHPDDLPEANYLRFVAAQADAMESQVDVNDRIAEYRAIVEKLQANQSEAEADDADGKKELWKQFANVAASLEITTLRTTLASRPHQRRYLEAMCSVEEGAFAMMGSKSIATLFKQIKELLEPKQENEEEGKPEVEPISTEEPTPEPAAA